MFWVGKSGRSLQHATRSREYTCMRLLVHVAGRGVVCVAAVCLPDWEIQDSGGGPGHASPRLFCLLSRVTFFPGSVMCFHSLFLVTFYSKPDAAYVS